MIARLLTVAALIFATVFSLKASDEYVFILRARGNPYWQTMAAGIEDAAKEKGIDAKVLMQESETAAEMQLDQCETAILHHPKMIILSATNTSIGLTALKKAQAEKIPTADIDSTLSYTEAKAAGLDLVFSIGSDNFKIGEQAADYVATLIGNNPTQALILEGAPGAAASTARVRGFLSEIKKKAATLQIVASISAMWERIQAMNITSDVLQRYPKLGIIYTANDVMALGAAEAIRAAGKSDQIKIIGIDGTADARKAVLEGRMNATIAQLPYLIGKRAVELAVAKVNGEKFDPVQITPTLVLTKEVLEQKSDPLLQYVR